MTVNFANGEQRALAAVRKRLRSIKIETAASSSEAIHRQIMIDF